MDCVKFVEFKKKVKIKFAVDENRYVIAKLEEVPKFSQGIFSIIKDKNEVTAIAREGTDLRSVSEEKFFRLITFNVNLPFDLSGFLSHISSLLSREDIPIFVVSSYSTDHIFVKEEYLDRALGILKENKMLQA
ncbi:MAG: ACT domain-containing protein [Candidatus Verstraetearchaeota archaeon]|nr:ACT domain-containing protein [Candidatus Verstraetearchaeota archaeon]